MRLSTVLSLLSGFLFASAVSYTIFEPQYKIVWLKFIGIVLCAIYMRQCSHQCYMEEIHREPKTRETKTQAVDDQAERP